MNEYITAARQFYPGCSLATPLATIFTGMHTTVLALFDNLFDMIPENERCGNQCVCIRSEGARTCRELGEIHVSAKEGEIEDLKKHMETCL